MLRRILALLLAAAALFSLAGCAPDVSRLEPDTAAAVTVLCDTGAVPGRLLGELDAPLSRFGGCQMLMSVYQFACGKYKNYSDEPAFPDLVGRRQKTQVTAGYELGLISGTDEGLFDPDGVLTAEQWAKLLCALCAKIECVDESALIPQEAAPDEASAWAAGYWAFARELELFGHDVQPAQPLDRADAAAALSRLLVSRGWERSVRLKNVYVPILMYHDISEDPSQWDDITVSPELFKSQLEAMRDAGFTAMTPEALLNGLDRGVLPEKPMLITFDDGYMSNYFYALPILEELEMPAAIFIIGGMFDPETEGEIDVEPPFFSSMNARYMERSPYVSIYSHSYAMHDENDGHPIGIYRREGESMTDYEARVTEDCEKARFIVEAVVGGEFLVYSYPYGYHTDVSERLLKSMGVRMTVTTVPGVADITRSTYLLPRINAGSDLSGEQLTALVESYMPKGGGK